MDRKSPVALIFIILSMLLRCHLNISKFNSSYMQILCGHSDANWSLIWAIINFCTRTLPMKCVFKWNVMFYSINGKQQFQMMKRPDIGLLVRSVVRHNKDGFKRRRKKKEKRKKRTKKKERKKERKREKQTKTKADLFPSIFLYTSLRGL